MQHARAAQRDFIQLQPLVRAAYRYTLPPRGTSLKAGLPGAIYILGLRPKSQTMRIFLDRTGVNVTKR